MGRDKALLPWGEHQLIDRIIDIGAQIVGLDRTMIVGDRPEYHGRGVSVVADDYPGKGPLGGIATALRHCFGERVLVVAVDMPSLSLRLLRAMVAKDVEGDALVPRTPRLSRDGRETLQVQALHAIYRVRCREAMGDAVIDGRLKVTQVFDSLRVDYLDPDWLRQFDPTLRSFENANTPDVFERLARAVE